jgi:hypothetical protein
LNTRVDYGQGSQSAVMEQDIEGTLNIRLLPEEAAGEQSRRVVLAAQFTPVNITISTNGQARQSDPRVTELLERVFLVTLSRRGSVEGFDFHPDLPPNLTSILEGAFRSLQILLPSPNDGKNAVAWRTAERDANGECLVSYSLSPDGTIRKRRLSYAPQKNEGDTISMRTAILSSDIRAEADDEWLKNLYANERSEFWSNSSTRVAAGENRVTLELLPFSPDINAQIWRETRTAAQIKGWYDHERNVIAALRQKQESKPVKALDTSAGGLHVYDVELAMRFVPELTTEHARLAELVAWLNANPEAALRVPGLILKIDDDTMHNYIILALQQSGTPHAQNALCTLLSEPQYGRMNRLRATAAFSFVKNPTEDAIKVLRAVADGREDEYASTAHLALGGSAYRVREATPERFAPLADDLVKRLSDAQIKKEPGGERVALLAIGNARDASFLPQVTPYLKGDDPAYREVAAGTLMHMRGPEVMRLLEERLNSDPEARVRRAAAKSLSEQPTDSQTVSFVIGRMDKEKDAAVQTDLVRYLGRSALRDTNARAALERLWAVSENRDVLRVIRDVRKGRTP